MVAASEPSGAPAGSRQQSLALVEVVRGADGAVERQSLLELLVGIRTPALGHEALGSSEPRLRLIRSRARSLQELSGSDEVAGDIRPYSLGPARRRVAVERAHELLAEVEATSRRRERRQVDDAELHVDAAAQRVEQL